MMFQTLRPWLIGTMFALLVPSWLIATAAEQTGGNNTPAVSRKQAEKLRGRLPAYFGKVVDASQRQEIYQIQADYKDRITKLQSALAEMVQQRDREILMVLTADQLAELKSLQKAARERSKQAAKEKDAPSR